MADLRIVDAPLLSTVKGTEKIPTGGEGNFSVSVNQVADFAKLKWVLATEGYVDNAVGNVQADLNLHKNNSSNPHQVTKSQVGLGNVDNTADLDKPVSNSTQAAINTLSQNKADKTYVDNQLTLKADKQDVYTKLETYTKQESADLVSSNISVSLTPINYSLDLAKRGVINTFNSNLSYNTNDRVVLSDGGFVVSTIDGNTNNPNTNMTGWFLPYMRGSQNLVELTNKATSRLNLDVYSKGEALAKNNNLSELTDKAIARTNLDVYSKTETNTAINNAKTILNNTLTSTETDQALTAAQGKVLKDLADTKLTTTSAFGVGQPWTNLTGSRTLGTTYTNSTGKSIYVSVRVGMTAGAGMSATVSGLQVCEGFAQNSASQAWAGFIVPNGSTYSVSASSLNTWSEMR